MSRQDLTLLKFPSTKDELIKARIYGLLCEMCDTDTDYVPEIIDMLVCYIEENFEGEYVWQVEIKLQEAKQWWKESMGEE